MGVGLVADGDVDGVGEASAETVVLVVDVGVDDGVVVGIRLGVGYVAGCGL